MTQSVGDRGSHTPGPWEAVRDESHFDTLSTVVAGAVTRFPGRQMMVQVGGSCGVAEQEANARLIAAAPALLEAGQRIADDYQTSDTHHPEHVLIRKSDFDALRAAIQSATGEG